MNSFMLCKIRKTISVFSLAVIVLLLSCPYSAFSYESTGTGTMSGKVLLKNGKPASAGMVYLYKENEMFPFAPHKYRPEPYEVAVIKRDGNFSVKLQAGSYFIEVVMRASNKMIGPPMAGEHQMISLDENSKPRRYIIKKGETNNIGNLTGLSPYKGMNFVKLGTGVTGTVRDRSGNPLSGAIVFAFTDRSMTGNALFISDTTGRDGKYILGVYKGGTYFLGIQFIDKDLTEQMSTYGGSDRTPLILKTGQVTNGIDITH